jgi:hypothetical protein
LQEGLRLTFYMDDANDSNQPDDLLADGVTHYDQGAQCWVAAVDWNTLRHNSEETGRSAYPVEMNGETNEEVETAKNRFDPSTGRVLGHP